MPWLRAVRVRYIAWRSFTLPAWVADHLPRAVVTWALLRAACEVHVTAGVKLDDQMTIRDTLKRWVYFPHEPPKLAEDFARFAEKLG